MSASDPKRTLTLGRYSLLFVCGDPDVLSGIALRRKKCPVATKRSNRRVPICRAYLAKQPPAATGNYGTFFRRPRSAIRGRIMKVVRLFLFFSGCIFVLHATVHPASAKNKYPTKNPTNEMIHRFQLQDTHQPKGKGNTTPPPSPPSHPSGTGSGTPVIH